MMRLIAASLLLLSSCATVAERKVVFLDGEQPDEGLVVCAVEKGRYACVRKDRLTARGRGAGSPRSTARGGGAASAERGRRQGVQGVHGKQ